jgi:hypothetical protein
MGSGLGKSEEDWKRQTSWSGNIHMHGNNTGKLPVLLPLSQTSKMLMFLVLSFMFFLLQN